MKTITNAAFLAIALAAPLTAQINFDSGTGASLASLIAAKRGAVAPVSAPARVSQPASGSCEPFSVERTVASIPIYDQSYSAGEAGESNICYAVVAAAMMDHWNLTSGGSGRQELISPLQLEVASARRSGEGGAGGQLTPDVLYQMANEDACTLGVTAGSRRSLSITEEADMIKRAQRASSGGQGKETAFGKDLNADDTRDSLTDYPETDYPEKEGASGDNEDGDYAKGEGGQAGQCRRVQVAPFNAQYQRTRQVSDGRGGTRGVRMTAEDIRAFMARNTANQPVGIKFRYDAVFGEPPAESGSAHWALIIARQMRGGTCQYLVRNSYGADHTQAWVDEARLAHTAGSLAVLGR